MVLGAMLGPSGRGELEITDVNNYYIYYIEQVQICVFHDARTFGGLLRYSVIVE